MAETAVARRGASIALALESWLWANVTYAHHEDRALALRYAALVEEIAARWPEHDRIQAERAVAWRLLE